MAAVRPRKPNSFWNFLSRSPLPRGSAPLHLGLAGAPRFGRSGSRALKGGLKMQEDADIVRVAERRAGLARDASDSAELGARSIIHQPSKSYRRAIVRE